MATCGPGQTAARLSEWPMPFSPLSSRRLSISHPAASLAGDEEMPAAPVRRSRFGRHTSW